ncbi:MAG: hypothetical protein D6769_01205 [Methanobacteriota archaeon]|nr:MAG: hypothetical protein D6769_01205 [Euryarchaeota archaeon]
MYPIRYILASIIKYGRPYIKLFMLMICGQGAEVTTMEATSMAEEREIVKKMRVKKLREGSNSTPVVYHYSGNYYVYKALGKNINMSLGEAQKLIRLMRDYMEGLNTAGVKTATNISLNPLRDSDKYIIEELSLLVDEGVDLSGMLERNMLNRGTAVSLYEELLEILMRAVNYNNTKDNIRSNILLDSAPRNFVMGIDGLTYVDFFFPKFWRDGHLYPFFQIGNVPREWHEFRFGDKRGLLIVALVYAMASTEKFDIKDSFVNATIDVLKEEKEMRVLNYVEHSIEKKFDNCYFIRRSIINRALFGWR